MLTRERSPLDCAAVASCTCVCATQIAPKGLPVLRCASRKKPAHEGPALCARRSGYCSHQPCPRQNTYNSTAARSRYLPAQRRTAFRGVALQRPTPDIRSAMTSARDPLPTIPHPNAAVKSHAQCLPRHCAATTLICWPCYQPNNDRRTEPTSSGQWVQRPAHRRH